jgi:hypothetical protein
VYVPYFLPLSIFSGCRLEGAGAMPLHVLASYAASTPTQDRDISDR